MELLAVPLPLQEELRLLQPGAETPVRSPLPSDVIAKQMMGLRFDTEVDNTAKSGRGPQGLPAPDDLLTSIRHDLDRARPAQA